MSSSDTHIKLAAVTGNQSLQADSVSGVPVTLKTRLRSLEKMLDEENSGQDGRDPAQDRSV